MIIQHNISAVAASGQEKINQKTKLKCLEKLNSGYKVNRSADDAAGLSISESMRAQIRGLDQSVRNIEDGVSYVQVADGALSEVHDILHRIRELSVQSVNDTNTNEDRENIDKEVQALKKEVDKIFETTEFNTIKIWDTKTNDRVQIGTVKQQAAKLINYGTQGFSLTEKNKGAIAYNGYQIEVQGTDENDLDSYGFKVTWEGWNKQKYSTELVSWKDVGTGSFSMKISDYIDTVAHPELEGIDFKLGWNTAETATIEDIAKAVDKVYYSNSQSSSEYISTKKDVSGVSFSITTNFLSELASDRNVEQYDTDWIEPKVSGTTNVATQPKYTNTAEDTGWQIKFTMKNIGTVTATSNDVQYYCPYSDEEENLWWRWVKYSDGTRDKSTLIHTPDKGASGTLLGVTDCITDSAGNGDSITKNSKHGGTIIVSFNIKPDSGSFNYNGRTGNSIGNMTMCLDVSKTDTEDTIMAKLSQALGKNSVIDAYEGNETTNKASRTREYIYAGKERTNMIDVPVYKAAHNVVIQAGANSHRGIHIRYDSLRTKNLGLEDTNVLTSKTATKAIAQVDHAEEIVSGQRSKFGAYQNRMEHAAMANANTSENLQISESKIRDADMADEAVALATADILAQASQSMIVQANSSQKGILELLKM